MSAETNEEQPKEIKEYKDFTSVTSIRKFTQQAMSPVIRSLEQQLSAIMDEHKDLTKKVSKTEDIFRTQNIMEQRIEDAHKSVRDFKDDQAQKRREDERKFTKLDTANQKLILEIHSLRTLIQNQDESIKQINQRSNKTHEMYGTLTTNTERTVKDMQHRYTEFTKEILDLTKLMKQQYNKNQNQMQVIRQIFKKERAALQEKTKPLSLYLSEREAVQQKYDELYTKIINSVTKKSQKIAIDDQIKLIREELDQTLPQSLRNLLPSIEKKLKEVEKIKSIEKNCKQLEINIQSTVKKITQASDSLAEKIQEIGKESEAKRVDIQSQFTIKINQLEQKQQEIVEKIEEKIQQMKLEIHEQMSEKIERETSQIHKTIEAEVASNRSIHRSNQMRSSALDEAVRKQCDEIRDIKQKMMSRYNKIEELGQSIDNKIQGYSNKITRIKSDYELFADNMRKEVSGVIKFRDTFLDRLQDVGRLLSSFTQALLITTSIQIQNSEQLSSQSGRQAKQPVVFVTENDGIVFEWKPDNQRGWIQYRREKMETKQFLRSFMYSLITFVDDQFTELSFLNWKDQKPSSFFKERVFSNYCTSRKRIMQSSSKEKVFSRRSPCYTSTPNCQNQNMCVSQTDQQILIDPCPSTKQFSRTIDSKAKFERVLEEGNFVLTNQEIPKNYSIKRSKPLSGRAANSKQKTATDLSRYDQVFLTSRSACRSRISQLV